MDQTTIIKEGNMSLTISNSGEFYSKHQSSNRSLSAVILLSYFMNITHKIKILNIADICCGIGSRSLCYLLYFKSKLNSIVIGYDNHKKSIELANINKFINQLNDYANYIHVNDAKEQLLTTNVLFDLIEIDPFGSPISYMKSALKCINRSHGILSLTFTGMYWT
jgi:tRNA G26 N,N-dimethylase Trm1